MAKAVITKSLKRKRIEVAILIRIKLSDYGESYWVITLMETKYLTELKKRLTHIIDYACSNFSNPKAGMN